ncbi:MAG: hypothetical protein ABIG31_04995 [Candidatus Omnitrophota bacterium]
MQKKSPVGIVVILLLALPLVCFGQDAITKASPQYEDPTEETAIEKEPLSECEKAGGQLTKIKECDDSESDWCVISEREQCYADQVKDGRCTKGEYSEELGGIVGIAPRVLCDGDE